MKALIAIAATAYALTLWMFAPRTIWDKELATAKRNQNRPTATSEMTPQPKPETIDTSETKLKSTQKAIPESIPQLDTIPEVTPKPEAIAQPTPEPKQSKQSIQTSEGTVYTNWTTTQLRDEAKKRKLNWRPIINGKRTPLKKPDLIALLTT